MDPVWFSLGGAPLDFGDYFVNVTMPDVVCKILLLLFYDFELFFGSVLLC